MSCNFVQSDFDGNQALKLTAEKHGSDWVIRGYNQGKNIIQIRRILVGVRNSSSNWDTMLYLRNDGWYPLLSNGKIEQGSGIPLYHLSSAVGSMTVTGVQMAAEYLEINQRSVSCQYTG